MGIVEDMEAFRGRYHQYIGAIEELRQAEEHRDRLLKVDERSFYARTGDDIVGRSRRLVATTRHDLVGAETRLSELRRDYASMRSQLLEQCQLSKEKDSLEQKRGELESLSSRRGYTHALLIAAAALGAASVFSWGSQLTYQDASAGAMAIASSTMLAIALTAGVTSYARIAKACFAKGGCLTGLLGLLVVGPLAFTLMVHVVFSFFLGPSYGDPSVIDQGPLLLSLSATCCLLGIAMALSRRRRAAELSERIASGEADIHSLGDLSKKRLASYEELNSPRIELAEAKVDALRALGAGEMAEIEETAMARAAILRAAEIAEANDRLSAKRQKVDSLHDESLDMVRSNDCHNLPEEEDWPAIDGLYELIRRGYADTRKEALLQYRAEARHAELIATFAEGVEELKAFREDVARQLDLVLEQETQLAQIAESQLGTLRQSLDVQANQLEELRSQTGQGEALIEQHGRIIAAQREANELAKRQAKRLGDVERMLSGVRSATTASAISSLARALK